MELAITQHFYLFYPRAYTNVDRSERAFIGSTFSTDIFIVATKYASANKIHLISCYAVSSDSTLWLK
jgi:hypothetical protein